MEHLWPPLWLNTQNRKFQQWKRFQIVYFYTEKIKEKTGINVLQDRFLYGILEQNRIKTYLALHNSTICLQKSKIHCSNDLYCKQEEL